MSARAPCGAAPTSARPPACASMNTRRDRDARPQAELRCRLGTQRAGGRSELAYFLRHLRGQVGESDRVQETRAEASLVREVVPLARQRADARDVLAAGAPDEVVGEVVEAPRGGVARGKASLEPQHLRQLHFDAHLAAHVGECRVAGGVDRRSLRHRAVVHRHHDVALRVAVLGHRDGRAAGGDGNQRARRVETDRGHRVDRRARSGDGGVDRCASALPDVLRTTAPRRRCADGTGGWVRRRTRGDAPSASKTPARTLPDPTSTPTKTLPLMPSTPGCQLADSVRVH